jgi:hypothetical protein
MTSLVSPANVKALINTAVSDDNLQEVIDRIEAQIVQKIGLPQDNNYTVEITKTLRGGEGDSLFLPTDIYSVTSIVEDDVTLEADEYRMWGAGVIERLSSTNWGSVCVVNYKPADDRPKRKQVIIDLVRLTIERTAMKSESIGGEYSYTATDDWDVEFRKAMKRLMFKAV